MIRVALKTGKLKKRIWDENRKRSLNYDAVAEYLVNQIKVQGKEILTNRNYLDLNGNPINPDIMDKLSYRVTTDSAGKHLIEFGAFDDPDASLVMQVIEWGNKDNPETPLFRKVIVEEEKNAVKLVKIK